MLVLAHKAISVLVKPCDPNTPVQARSECRALCYSLSEAHVLMCILQMEKNVLSPKFKPLTTQVSLKKGMHSWEGIEKNGTV